MGEELAVKVLAEAGLTVLDRNWRCPRGELDIVAQEDAPDFASDGSSAPWLVFVEVRTRRGTQYGTALQSITAHKQAKLREVAEWYLQENPWAGPWRIDVVAIELGQRGEVKRLNLIRWAFEA